MRLFRETLEEARELAVEEHFVEFPTDLWVAESFCSKGMHILGTRRGARGRLSAMKYGFINYFVR